MALNCLKLWLWKPAGNFPQPSVFKGSIQRFSWAARMSSSHTKVDKSSAGTDSKQDDSKTGTNRKPGVRPEHDPSKVQPHAVRYNSPKMKFVLQGVDLTKYTTVPIPYPKTGGRGWDGKVMNKRIGGGAKQEYRMVDYTRNAISEEEPLVEKVIYTRYDPLRSADIALVASGNHKRWIIAGEHMKKGDLIKSYGNIPTLPVSAKAGDAHPLGAYAAGTVVHNIEMFENEGGNFARAAGTSGTIARKVADRVIVRLPSGREASLSKNCIATCGRASNVNHGKEHIGSAQRNRWFGVRPKCGLWHRKTGYNGRKIRPPKPLVTYEKKTQKSLHEMFDT
ncbi:39S ribosomal protein L2, mitochondrial-like [Mercenaria mercenaria]|uniref:39S ribosomal protein L2, mitochondrial-like n=1 Tax=Mercenaria mercenaria TaxID=6596 RepID=UPI00234FAA89|nr:39S ribosomal protein L2, mitochondrial-like [Mercenaria mercenaria]